MPIYVYETVTNKADEEPKIYEIVQSIKADPLTTHPKTGETIRRVFMGKFGILSATGNSGPGCSGPGCCG